MSGYYYNGIDIKTIINNSSTKDSPATLNNSQITNFTGTGNSTGLYLNNTNYTSVQSNILSNYFKLNSVPIFPSTTEAYSIQCTTSTTIPIPSGCNSIYFYAISGGGGGGGASGGAGNYNGGAGGAGANGVYLSANYPITSGSINFTINSTARIGNVRGNTGAGGVGGNANANTGDGGDSNNGQGFTLTFPNIICTATGGVGGNPGQSAGNTTDGNYGANSNTAGTLNTSNTRPANFQTTTTFPVNAPLIYNPNWIVQPRTTLGYNTKYGYGLGGLGGSNKSGNTGATYGPNNGTNIGYPGFSGGPAFAQFFFFYQ